MRYASGGVYEEKEGSEARTWRVKIEDDKRRKMVGKSFCFTPPMADFGGEDGGVMVVREK